ncbi:GNAT family N-acetyltransferase [Longimycelium tulufanense]|uniref:GNAT family N-acetyltransferase n=1 Tax=Longimycelium tulufanense TaxID=907463 RepID=UPI001E45ECE5|nr:GNAT family N-acetyltransferase [Longimycelium tulufanense]
MGIVQLDLETKPNGRHRGEIAKLMVHRRARGQGLGKALLAHAEREAAALGVSLLVLDTQSGSGAEQLYRAAGWNRVGVIPDYAADPVGELHPTTIFYRSLGGNGQFPDTTEIVNSPV